MRIYKKDYTDELITGDKYDKLYDFEKEEYSYYKSVSTGKSSGDPLLSGIIGYATDSVILGTLLGGSLLGGVLGDLLDGDLMD